MATSMGNQVTSLLMSHSFNSWVVVSRESQHMTCMRSLLPSTNSHIPHKSHTGRWIYKSEYKRGISSWNFDLEDLKIQAALVQDNDELSVCSYEKDAGECSNSLFELADFKDKISLSVSPSFALRDDTNEAIQSKATSLDSMDHAANNQRSKFVGTEKECEVDCSSDQGVACSVLHDDSNLLESSFTRNCNVDVNEGVSNHASTPPCHQRMGSSSSCTSDAAESGLALYQNQNGAFDNGTVAGVDVDGKSKGGIVQQKGRFKVTSENLELEKASPSVVLAKSYSMQAINQLPANSLSSPPGLASNQPGSQLLPQLLSMLQMNNIQRDSILHLIKQVSTGDTSATQTTDNIAKQLSANITEKSLLELAYEKEKELLQEISELQWRLTCSQEEILRLKTRNAQV